MPRELKAPVACLGHRPRYEGINQGKATLEKGKPGKLNWYALEQKLHWSEKERKRLEKELGQLKRDMELLANEI